MQDTQARQLLVAEARRLALVHDAVDVELSAGQADADTRPASDRGGPDAAAVTLELELEVSLRLTIDDERAEIAFALARLDEGTYGTCTACGGTIPDERLELVPATRFCVPCEMVAERRRDQGLPPGFDTVVVVDALREVDGWADDDRSDDDVSAPGAEEAAVHTRPGDGRRP